MLPFLFSVKFIACFIVRFTRDVLLALCLKSLHFHFQYSFIPVVLTAFPLYFGFSCACPAASGGGLWSCRLKLPWLQCGSPHCCGSSLLPNHGLWATRLQWLLLLGLSSSKACEGLGGAWHSYPGTCGIFLDQPSKPYPELMQADSTTGPPGCPLLFIFQKSSECDSELTVAYSSALDVAWLHSSWLVFVSEEKSAVILIFISFQ